MAVPLLLAFAVSSIIAGIAFWRGSLSASGAMGAVLIGGVTFGLGGWTCGLLLVLFFITSSALSRFREADKRKPAEAFEKGSRRDLGQVLANGGAPAALALASGLVTWEGWLAMFIGALAAATADTWATELGMLSRARPRLITTGEVVPVGTSGGISVRGTLAAVAGGATIGLAAGLLPRGLPWWTALPLGLVSGLAGSVIDSLLGASLQRQGYCPSCQAATEARIHYCGAATELTRGCAWFGNDVVNFLASLAGGLIALVSWLSFTAIGS
jgi:uncharacterized protein (TIGR00297 family)